MINKKNWPLMKKFLEHRFREDQITKGSLKKEQTHMRYILEWAQETTFRDVMKIRPTLPEFILSRRLDGKTGQLSATYLKKILATARSFFSWLSDNEPGFKSIKIAWIKTLKIKRLSDVPKTRESVTLEEVQAIATIPVQKISERRARAAAVFLFLSGMRIGAFVSLPIQAVDIPNLTITQFPSLGVRTKNRKSGITYLLNISELVKVIQEWDDEVRAILPPTGFWFAPLSPKTGQIDLAATSVGEHRATIARRNINQYMKNANLPYHSPHKFRHGHVHFCMGKSKGTADFKAVSMNVLHSSMEITDQFYSNLNDGEIQNRMGKLTKQENSLENDEVERYKQYLEWKKKIG